MKKSVMFLAMLLSTSAFAADMMPLKAPTAINAGGGGGWYIGVGSEAAVAQANVSGTNLFATSLVGGDLKAAGGAIKGVVGYINPKLRFEASIGYQNITGSDTAGNASVASRWSASQEVDVNFSLFQNILTAVGNIGFAFPSFNPVLPSNITVAAMPRQYVGFGAREFGINGTFGAASGSTWSASPMIKSGFIYQAIDGTGKSTGGAWDAFAWVSFPMRGITFDNAFAANGQPLTFGAGANLGTQYGLGLHYDFGLGG